MSKSILQASLERNYALFKMTENIPSIAVENFFSDVYNSVSDFMNFHLDLMSDTEYLHAVRHENKVKTLVSEVSYNELANVYMIVPKDLDVDLNELMQELLNTHKSLTPSLLEALKSTETSLGLMIKELSQNGVIKPSSRSQSVKKVTDIRNKARQTFGKMFNSRRPIDQAPVVEVFNSNQDILKGFELAFELKEEFTSKISKEVETSLDRFSRTVESVVEELHASENENLKNSRGLKEISDMVYELAVTFEFYGYLQGKVLQTYRSIESMSDNIIKDLS